MAGKDFWISFVGLVLSTVGPILDEKGRGTALGYHVGFASRPSVPSADPVAAPGLHISTVLVSIPPPSEASGSITLTNMVLTAGSAVPAARGPSHSPAGSSTVGGLAGKGSAGTKAAGVDGLLTCGG